MDPGTLALITAGIGAAGSIGGGFLSGRSNQPNETKLEKQKRHLVDDLISSLHGQGSYNDLYNTDESVFQKSFVDPAKSIFNRQIAPQIQQQFISNGQQRGTGLDDQLLRAGVDLDQLLNSQYSDFIQQGMNRKQNTISGILGGSGGIQPKMNNSDILGNSVGGYLNSGAFQDAVSGINKAFGPQPMAQNTPPRKGYAPDWHQQYQQPLGSSSWGQNQSPYGY